MLSVSDRMEPSLKREHTQLLEDLSGAYRERFLAPRSLVVGLPRSWSMAVAMACVSTRPFPVRIESAECAYIHDVDGHQILDFWQGHFTNVLGNNPPLITSVFGGFCMPPGRGCSMAAPRRFRSRRRSCSARGFAR